MPSFPQYPQAISPLPRTPSPFTVASVTLLLHCLGGSKPTGVLAHFPTGARTARAGRSERSQRGCSTCRGGSSWRHRRVWRSLRKTVIATWVSRAAHGILRPRNRSMVRICPLSGRYSLGCVAGTYSTSLASSSNPAARYSSPISRVAHSSRSARASRPGLRAPTPGAAGSGRSADARTVAPSGTINGKPGWSAWLLRQRSHTWRQ